MATEHNWISHTGDWNATPSWDSSQTPGDGGVSTDTATFDGTSQKSVTQNLDRSGDNALKRIVTYPEYTGNVGWPGDPLIHEMDSTDKPDSRVIHRGSGSFYFQADAGGFSDVLCDSPNMLNAMQLGGTLRKVFIKRGYVAILADATISQEVNVDGLDARLFIGVSGNGVGTVNTIKQGFVECLRDIAANKQLIIEGGTWLQRGAMAADAQIQIARGGRLIYAPQSAVSATGPDIRVNGIIDLSMAQRKIYWHNIIVGRDAVVYGAPHDVGGRLLQAAAVGNDATNVDLREEFP